MEGDEIMGDVQNPPAPPSDHVPHEEWVGYPITACSCGKPWPDYMAGWSAGWYAHHFAEDYTAIIGRLRVMKPQEGAFFLLGEITQVAAQLHAEANGPKQPVVYVDEPILDADDGR